jgi:large subunit ribosomal protein L10
MSNIKEAKQLIIDEISSKIDNAQSVVVFEYQGLSVADFEALRNELRKENVDVKIYKNNLSKRAIADGQYAELSDGLTGPNAIAFSNDDAVAGARIISKFAKDHETIKMKTGIIEGNVVQVDELKEIAQLPSRDGLLSMLLSVLQAPMRDVAMITDAVANKMEENNANTAADVVANNTQTEENVEATDATTETNTDVEEVEPVSAETEVNTIEETN